MRDRWSGSVPALIAGALALTCVTVIAVRASQGPPQATVAATATPAVTVAPAPAPSAPAVKETFEGGTLGAITTRSETPVRARADGRSPALSAIRAGVTLPVLRQSGRYVEVMTPCERTGWVGVAGVDAHAQSRGSAGALRDATIVLDPGHGGPESGATGPRGLKESTVNLDIAKRVAQDLHGPRVFLTRSDDYMAGLVFRAAMANSLHADAFISIHNNANPDGPSPKPGTETFYQTRSLHSKRLAGLTYEEIEPALAKIHSTWMADKDAGAKFRTNARGIDYYAVLRRSVSPAVITESLYISDAPEEALLRQGGVRQIIADAIGRAVTRYVTTTDPGSGFVTPLVHNEGSTFVLPTTCRDPS